MLTLVPHWNWSGREGQPIKVMAACNADSVALSLNGKLIEERKLIRSRWFPACAYAPGKLEAVAKRRARKLRVTSWKQPANR